MGAASLEYIISDAALKCQSRKNYEGHAVEYALLFWTLIYTIRAGFMKLLQKKQQGLDSLKLIPVEKCFFGK